MKYIRTEQENGIQEIFVFPLTVNHDCMAEALERMKNQTHGQWERVWRHPVSAGFVTNGKCHGESVTLGLESLPDDTEILAKQI